MQMIHFYFVMIITSKKMLYNYCKILQKIVSVLHKTIFRTKTKKTELILYSKKHQGINHKSKISIMLDDTKKKPKVKFSGIIPDQFLTFHVEVKIIF